MPFVSPFLPKHYAISESVRRELDALSSDLGLELVSKSRTPIFGPLGCLQVERGLYDERGKEIFGIRVAARFRLGRPAKPELDKSRALCAALSLRNHKRKFEDNSLCVPLL